ncbi:MULTISPECIES: alpha-D-ribose 1-methylphosphonate 5-triphosphate diphosphatase [Paracoccus]|jgi:alpha-D-ribose 1-methylphosphonate 5-triphosphate diphosphatase|uniref:Phosphonate metabolism protein PhnM n=1 Tax=Paracoccus denitrificans (strain Pd 1222) TaxID=318586 RepID=A1BAE1_PARDP|nr:MULTISPECIES: alpha-D-ribose 1-methylphosphonate 5-triphosphate diphosphatase [Paracoccus]ABL72485.1 phosphonate metabolism protein PhnM [Paracoccus denitrificans PD1222]MBB4626477.1 alpha-D-ribose 1-methylphosphonate 5-triphosphate diphosphatase [Paracoccus denitrificans]MCU7430381.1 alpha-D-ribose 1-methylphosphonate 5-triphosphate diphosphatase [Paracoccus denitrificans]MDK8873016.1 alpha-D-ribose 1-methylphosphonate 5-triphosphate diphosphatase [Paracoccus sp. SSJ]QAR29031.1 alpha-D-rib
MTRTILANARLILPEAVTPGAIVVEDGAIAAIQPGTAVPAGALDMGGDYLAPGMVELHTDNLERHIRPRPGVDWPHAAAILAHDAELAGCGITTVFDAMRVGSIPNEGPDQDYDKYARELAHELAAIRARDALRISHFLHLRAEICSQTLLAELDEFGPEDRVGIISLMDHTPGQRQFRDVSKLAQYVQGKYKLSDAEFADHVARLKDLRARFGDRHEAAAVEIAHRLGAVLASHDDTTAEHVALSAGHGVRLAEFPTTPEAAAACHDHGIMVMMGAPNLIRGGSHSGNVSAAELARAGHLDILSSDYVPSGLLAGALILARIWDDLPRAVATVTANPARAAGLADRGRLAPGLRADLIRFAMLEDTPVMRETWVRGRRV